MLRHQEIVQLQQDPYCKIPQKNLFNALSYKLGGANNPALPLNQTFKGPRAHYSVQYLMEVGNETKQAIPQNALRSQRSNATGPEMLLQE